MSSISIYNNNKSSRQDLIDILKKNKENINPSIAPTQLITDLTNHFDNMSNDLVKSTFYSGKKATTNTKRQRKINKDNILIYCLRVIDLLTKVNDDGTIDLTHRKIHSKVFRKLTTGDLHNNIIKFLIENNYLSVISAYKVKNDEYGKTYTKSYAIHDSYKDDSLQFLLLNCSDSQRKTYINNTDNKFNKVENITIDFDSALEFWLHEDENPTWKSLKLIINVYNKCYHYTQDQQGRVYSEFTMMKSEYRQFLMCGDDTLVEIDIKTCQPAILNNMIGESNPDLDLSKFNKVLNYDLYNYFIDLLMYYIVASDKVFLKDDYIKADQEFRGLYNKQLDKDIFNTVNKLIKLNINFNMYYIVASDKNEIRKKIKTEVMRYMLGSGKKGFIAKIMKLLIPDLHKWLLDFKRFEGYDEETGYTYSRKPNKKQKRSYSRLAHYLHRKESDVVISRLCNSLNNLEIDNFSIHDCVFVPKSKVKETKLIFEESLNDCNLNGITLKTKVYTEPNKQTKETKTCLTDPLESKIEVSEIVNTEFNNTLVDINIDDNEINNYHNRKKENWTMPKINIGINITKKEEYR